MFEIATQIDRYFWCWVSYIRIQTLFGEAPVGKLQVWVVPIVCVSDLVRNSQHREEGKSFYYICVLEGMFLRLRRLMDDRSGQCFLCCLVCLF